MVYVAGKYHRRHRGAGRMNDFKVVDNQCNSSREAIHDKVCVQAFGKKNPTKSEAFKNYGPMVARMSARGTQGRANKSRQLRLEAAGAIESYGPKILSKTQLDKGPCGIRAW